MKSRPGQVALYLTAVLAAVCLLTLMNVTVFLSVSAKNRAMNAADAAALSVAKMQGELINSIGELNAEHLKTLLDDSLDDERKLARAEEIVMKQKRLCFLGPLEGLQIGNRAARENGIVREATGGMRRILQEHLDDIRLVYVNDPELFPEPWQGAWDEYAVELQLRLGGELLAGPENPEFADAWTCDPLVNQGFYNAIAGRQWCWFKFNGTWMFDCDSSNMPHPSDIVATPHWNCELYSLHLTFRPFGALDDDAVKSLAKATGCDERQIRKCKELLSPDQYWAFYDSTWGRWSSVSDSNTPFSPDFFPIVGSVKEEYDVRGCAAKCRVVTCARDVLHENAASQCVVYTSAAKPFGTVENADGSTAAVTAYRDFVTSPFSDVRLVPADSVGRRDLDGGADYDWMVHVRKHIPQYLANGPTAVNGCWYCRQLVTWENAAFRQSGRRWLRYHADECSVGCCGSPLQGGAVHAH